MSDEQQPERMSVADAAARLGVSVDTIRRKIKRRELIAQRDNMGKWWVLAPQPAAHADAAPTPKPMQQPAYAPAEPMQQPDTALVSELRARLADKDAELARLGTLLEQERTERRADAERHRQDTAAAAAERGRLLDLLADTQRPWWRRLIGGR